MRRQDMMSKLSDQDAVSMMRDQDTMSKIRRQDMMSKIHDQDMMSKMPDQDTMSKMLDQDVMSKLSDQDVVSKMRRQDMMSRIRRQDMMSKIHDQDMMSRISDQGATNKLSGMDAMDKMASQDTMGSSSSSLSSSSLSSSSLSSSFDGEKVAGDILGGLTSPFSTQKGSRLDKPQHQGSKESKLVSRTRNPLVPYMLPAPKLDDPEPDEKAKAAAFQGVAEIEMQSQLSKVQTKLSDSSIIPDVLGDKFKPEFLVNMNFNGQAVSIGQLLTINDTRTEPVIEFDSQPGQVFTVAIVDPDSPATNRHGYRSYRHFLVANLDASEEGESNVITEYQPPQPPFGTGLHRYAVVVLKQQERINVTEADVPESRIRFDIVEWGKERNMRPVAASYFLVKRNHINEKR
ncbi:PEBP-like protein [Martensiomyces pterosporus]|nr:PEBP-like protein [Martensiomyces pterosporus]